jgi:hypothetical protein
MSIMGVRTRYQRAEWSCSERSSYAASSIGVFMNARQLLFISPCVFALGLGGVAVAQEMQGQYVQIAEIEIDPAQLENTKLRLGSTSKLLFA